MKTSLPAIVAAAVVLASGCVPHDRYDAAVSDARTAHLSADQCNAELAHAKEEIARLEGVAKEATARADQRDTDLAAAQVATHDLQTKLDDATAQNAELRAALDRLGKNADALLAEKGTLGAALSEAKQRLDELRKAQAAADTRAALFRDLALKFRKMIDAGQLKVKVRDGRMVLELANDVLFDSGQTNLKPDGQKALTQLAAVLKTIPNRRFQVAGDTDNVPIGKSAFPSNWELSAARAVEVVRYLVKAGVNPPLLSAAGYGEYDPIAPNDTPAGRAKNRRIEITLQPNIEELVAIPDGK
ncbi:MAG TPA: OmpA family protein [Polyangiaceae bacterium]|nr:OmpA family protein [Polyangiaceae bacterium]